MNVSLLFALVSIGALLATLLVTVLLRGQLRRILVDLCNGEDRAEFWVSVSSVWIVLVGLLAGTASLGYFTQGGDTDLFGGATTQVRWMLVGLLGAVLAIAGVVMSAIRQRAAGVLPPPPPPLP